MQCSQCGFQNSTPDAKFCNACGSKLTQPLSAHLNSQTPQDPGKPEKWDRTTVSFLVCAGLFFVGLFIVIGINMSGLSSKSTAERYTYPEPASSTVSTTTQQNVQIESATPFLSPSPSPHKANTLSAPSAEERQSDGLAASRRHVEEFNAALSAPAIKVYMASAKLSDLSSDDLQVTVTARWHYEPKTIRLQMAQVIWKAWAGIHQPDRPDTAYLTLRDAAGNKVGGSRITGGSFIWVAD